MSLEDTAIPSNWTWTTIGELVQSMRNGIYKPASEYADDGVVTLRMYNIQDGSLSLHDLRRVRLTPSELEESRLVPGDLFVNRVNSAELVGKSCIIPPGLGIFSYESKNIRVRHSDGVEPSLVNQWFRTVTVRAYLTSSCKQTTGMASLDQDQLASLPFPLPPLAEQRRIVAKIEALQIRNRNTRETLEAVPPLLEQFRQSVLAAAFRGDLTADWREQHPDAEPADVLLDRIRQERRRRWELAELSRIKSPPKDDRWKAKYQEPESVDESELPELPDGWCWASVEQVASVGSGLTRNNTVRASATTWVPLLTVAAVRLRSIDSEGVKEIGLLPDDDDTGKLEPDDLLIVEGNGSLDHIGRVALWDNSIPNARHQNHLIRVRPIVISSRFVLEWLASPMGRELLAREATTTAGLYNLSLSKVGRIRLPIPPLEEQVEIVRQIDTKLASATGVETAITTALEELRQLDQVILAKAFRGELLPQDPSDEPASVLLERIRAEKATFSRSRRSPNRNGLLFE